MKKFSGIICTIIIAAIPMVAQSVGSTSGVSGTATETNAAIYTQSYNIPGAGNYTFAGTGGSFGSSGSQSATSSFSAQTTPYFGDTNDNASGNAFVTGGTTVTGSFIVNGNTATSTAWGNTNNNGNVNVSDSPSSNFNTVLSGSGSLGTNSFSFIGGFAMSITGSMTPTNGAFAQGSTCGTFNYSAQGGSGWIGSGSTTQWTTSQVSGLVNGFSATTSSSVNSTACPK